MKSYSIAVGFIGIAAATLHADQIAVSNLTPFDLHLAIYYQNGPAERVTTPVLIKSGGRISLDRPSRRFWYDRQVYMCVNDDQLKKVLTRGETDILSSFNIGALKGTSFTISYDYKTGKFNGYSPLDKASSEALSMLKAPAVSLTKEFRENLKRQYRPYPYEGKHQYVRIAQPITLSVGEKASLQARDEIVRASIEKLIGRSIPQSKVPRIAICASGGGIRSTIATLGALAGAQDAEFYNALSYMAGLSGGAWAVSGIATTNLSPKTFLDQFSTRVMRGVLSDVVMGELLTILWKKVAFNQPISSIDLYGALITQRILGWHTNDLSKLRLSEQGAQAVRGSIPYPIYSALTTKEIPYRWIEFTPHEVGSEYLGGFIPTYALGTSFSGGSSMPLDPEQPLSWFMGTWGSAFSANIGEMVKEITKGISAPILKDLLGGVTNPEEVGRVRLWPSKIANFTRGIDGAPRAAQELLTCIDAGLDFNIPIPPLLRSDRAIDIIIVIDNSQGITATSSGAELEKAAAYAQRNRLRFPPIDKKKFATISQENPYVIFEGGSGPIIFYIPLIKNGRSTFDPSVCMESGPCSTYNFQYTPVQTRGLASVPAEVMKQIKPALIDAIKRVITRS